MKSAATVVFVRKLSQDSNFKKDSQFNSNFSIGMWCRGCVVVPLHKRFSLIRQTAIILKDKTQFLLYHTQKKIIIFKFSFFGEYVNIYYIHWT